jgi:hypothetical protein
MFPQALFLGGTSLAPNSKDFCLPILEKSCIVSRNDAQQGVACLDDKAVTESRLIFVQGPNNNAKSSSLSQQSRLSRP